MSEEAKQKLVREIDQNTKSLNRETEDARRNWIRSRTRSCRSWAGA